MKHATFSSRFLPQICWRNIAILLVFARPAYADGIMIEAVIAVGLLFAIPITIFIVVVEGLIASRILKIEFKYAAAQVLIANVISTLCGIPMMIAERAIYYEYVPKDLHLYFRVYLFASVVTYLVFLVITILIEWLYWVWRLRDWKHPFTFGRLASAIVLGNVLTYAALCPLHYLFTSPSADVGELTGDTRWESQPITSIYYIDGESQHLNRIETNGTNKRTAIPNPLEDYLLSGDQRYCVYISPDKTLYHFDLEEQERTLVCENFNSHLTTDQVALSGDGKMIVTIEKPKSEILLNSYSLIEGASEIRSATIAKIGSILSFVAWGKDSDTIYVEDGNDSFGLRLDPEGKWVRIPFTPQVELAASYGVFHDDSPYWGRTWIENGGYRVGAYHGPMESFLTIKKGEQNHLFVWDNPGYLRIPKRKFYNPSFLSDGKEVLVEDDYSIYLIDLATRKMGIVARGTHYLTLTNRYKKDRLFSEDQD